jgi:Uma2 family endonuclease
MSVDEYLNTSFDGPDREYVDGEVVERNLGEKPHSDTQKRLIGFFLPLEQTRGIFAYPEQRVQVKSTRFRVPDVCVYLSEPNENIFHAPPFLAIEILSKDDRAGDLEDKLHDYFDFGVRFVWVIDPLARRAYIYTSDRRIEVKDGILRTADPDIALPLGQLF